jgi:hypothetical protein
MPNLADLTDILDTRRDNGRSGRRGYFGYEDYSPEGRAAIDAFNKAGGDAHLGINGDIKKYMAAVRAAQQAAMEVLIKKQSQGLSLGQMLGTEPIYPPSPYQYPPK